MITLTKKVLLVLISVVLAVSCMMVPAMAEGQTWTLSAEDATTIEMEWFFFGFDGQPTEDKIPEFALVSPAKNWWPEEKASNGYLYSIGWERSNLTHTFNVVAPAAQNYNIEFVASDKSSKSEISVYVGGTLVADTNTDEGKELYTIGGENDPTSIKRYIGTNIPLNAGNNTIEIRTTNQNIFNAYEMDYIKFTPVKGEEHSFAVVGIEDNTVNPTCISIVFNKPITSAEGITVTAQHGTPIIAVDANNANKVKITGIAGRTTITVPEGFKDATGNDSLAEAYVTNVFAYPFDDTESKSYADKSQCEVENRKVGAKIGATQGMAVVTRRVIIALYDGDKMVAVADEEISTVDDSLIHVYFDEGVKFTEAKVFTLWEVNNELIPLGKAAARTAEQLGFTFE